MEKRKDTISVLKLCRFCLSQDDSITSIYDRTQKVKNTVNLPLKILSCLSIEAFPSDKMPTYICSRCSLFMDVFYQFKEICRSADQRILQYIQTGTTLQTLEWPESLNNIFQNFKRQPKSPHIVKAVMGDGGTVKVTSQEVSSEDDDDEDVYNVKIGEGTKDIEVVVSNKNNVGSEEIITKPKVTEFTCVSKLTRHVRSHAGDRPYPCKYCNKSFLKSHHYTRHLRVKHRETLRNSRGPFGQTDFRCDQCEEMFSTQDELIYHSAIHATQNLTCPLCHEKFENVDAVTAHIKSHVNGIEFMCDLCELVFTTREKLENHLTAAHADELGQDDSSMELDGDEFEDDNDINVKEEDGEMVVEIKKTDGFMLPDLVEKADITQSEESESEVTYAELSTVDTLAIVRKDTGAIEMEVNPSEIPKDIADITPVVVAKVPPKPPAKSENQTASILRKAEEVKRKVQQTVAEAVNETREKTGSKVESSNSVGGASDKSLRLLEKELQELKRTNTRNDSSKPPAKPMDNLRNRRPQLYTSTPKTRATEEKKAAASNKSPAIERKVIERRVTKENKEPKEIKDTKEIRDSKEIKEVRETKEVKEAKEVKEIKEIKEAKEIKDPKEVKETKEVKDTKEAKETKEARETKEAKEMKQNMAAKEDKETPKNTVKNGTGKGSSEETVRRSTRPSKIKDYAKMIRDKSQIASDEDSDTDEEYKEVEKTETRARPRRSSFKVVHTKAPAPAPVVTTPARKRGRPRKEVFKELPAKIKKAAGSSESMETDLKTENDNLEDTSKKPKEECPTDEKQVNSTAQVTVNAAEKTTNDVKKSPSSDQIIAPGGVMMSPTGQTLKKVPIRSLPPGVKPLPLPVGRPMGPGELCEMQIGKKVVKVQKIVMTKAEVEAMAKQGLVEMKDGTMVLKQGIKLPSSETLKSTLIGDKDAAKESPVKTEKPATTQGNAVNNS